MLRRCLSACVAVLCLLHCSGSINATRDTGSPDATPSAGDASADEDAGAQGGQPCVVAASAYDRACKADSDCVGVPAGGDTCGPNGPPSGDEYCPLAAVNAAVAAQYKADLQAALASHGTLRSESCPAGLPPPACVSGTCTTAFLSAQDAGNTVDASDAGDAGTAADGGAGVDCGTQASTPDTLILLAYGGASGEVAAEATFPEYGVGLQQTCNATVNAGACQLTNCQVGGIGSPAWGYGNFGPMTASVGATTVPITYESAGYGTVYFPSSTTLGTGGIMTFRGGNACGVPAFDIAATIPGLAVITSPVPTTDAGAAIIDTSKDLSVTWAPIAIGQVHFTLRGGTGLTGGTAITIACTFDGSSGSGVVAQTLLSTLKTLSGTNPTYADLSSEADTSTVVDGLIIQTQSYQDSPSTGNDFTVTLQ